MQPRVNDARERLLRRRVFYKTCTVGDCIRNAPLLYIYGKSGTKVPLFFDYKKLVEANALGHHLVFLRIELARTVVSLL